MLAFCLICSSILSLTACQLGGQQVDYATFVQFEGIQYLAFGKLGRNPLEGDVGPIYETVKRNGVDSGFGLSNRPEDGDAAGLPPGTPVYRVNDYAPTFRLVAHASGKVDTPLLFYQVTSNPHAHTGADLLDIGGKVTSLDIYSGTDATRKVATISDTPSQARLIDLVSLVLAGSIDESRRESGASSYIVVFQLRDGTAVADSYWLHDRWLFPGIVLPPAFDDALRHALGS